LDIRLSLDLYLQYRADELMLGHSGAAILMNAQSGEILVMSSHPTFNPNHLDEIGVHLNKDPEKPLINRAVQGTYPAGSLIKPFAQALYGNKTYTENELRNTFGVFGFNRTPQLPMAVPAPFPESDVNNLHVSPMQVALAASTLSNHGTAPAPRIVVAVNTPEQGWVVFPAMGTPFDALQPSQANSSAESLIVNGKNYWARVGSAKGDESPVTWFIAGTPPNWQAAPLVVVVALEEENERLAQLIGQELLTDAMNP
jgi:membrane peptidoglycan carboxypeptidase